MLITCFIGRSAAGSFPDHGNPQDCLRFLKNLMYKKIKAIKNIFKL